MIYIPDGQSSDDFKNNPKVLSKIKFGRFLKKENTLYTRWSISICI